MIFSLSSRDARALKFGLVAVVPLAVFRFAVKPYATALSGAGENLRIERELLARELRVIDEHVRYDTLQSKADIARAGAEERLFVGVDEVAAAAALTRHVREQATGAALLVQKIETRSAEALGDQLFSIDLIFRGESDLEGVLSFLRQLEIGEKLVTIPSLRVEPVATGESTASELTVLAVNMTVRGYALLHDATKPTSRSAK